MKFDVTRLAVSCLLVLAWSLAGAVDGTLLVVNKSGGSVSLIAASTWETLAELDVGGRPHEVAVSPDGTRAVVSDYEGTDGFGRQLVVIDISRQAVESTIDLTPYSRPHGLAWLNDGRHVLVTAETDDLLLIVDVLTHKVISAIPTGQKLSHMVALNAAGTRAYVANILSGTVSVIDVQGRSLLSIVKTGSGSEGVAVHPTNGQVWVTLREENRLVVLDPATLARIRSIPVGEFPVRIAFSHDGTTAFVTNARSSSLSLVDVQTNHITEISVAGDFDWQRGRNLGGWLGTHTLPVGVLALPDSETVLVANAHGGYVSVIRWNDGRIATFRAGAEPDGLAYSPVVPRPQVP